MVLKKTSQTATSEWVIAAHFLQFLRIAFISGSSCINKTLYIVKCCCKRLFWLTSRISFSVTFALFLSLLTNTPCSSNSLVSCLDFSHWTFTLKLCSWIRPLCSAHPTFVCTSADFNVSSILWFFNWKSSYSCRSPTIPLEKHEFSFFWLRYSERPLERVFDARKGILHPALTWRLLCFWLAEIK